MTKQSNGYQYNRIANDLILRVLTKEFVGGVAIQSVRVLSKHYAVNPATICKAILVLKNKGYITKRNRRHYVVEHLDHESIKTDLIKSQIHEIAVISKQLNIREDTLITEVQRLLKESPTQKSISEK